MYMNITPEIIAPLLHEYGISSSITEILFYRNYSGADGIKIVARVDVKHRPPLVIRLTQNPRLPHEQAERRSVFSEHLRRNGIPTPERYSKGGEYCLERIIGNKRVDVTLEDWCGDGLTEIDKETAADAGRMMARIHRNSFRDNFKIGAPTDYNAIGKNNVSGIEKFRELAKMSDESRCKSLTYPQKLCNNPELCNEIIDIYERKIANAAEIWDRLPCAAVQGGISIENLTRRDGVLTVFDYNAAGDETLIGDMILEGMILAYETKLAPGLTDADRPEIYASFLGGYRKICPLTHDERIAACELHPAYNALWFSRVCSNNGKYPNSLEAVMTGGDCDRADRILTRMYELITEDARKIYANELFADKSI